MRVYVFVGYQLQKLGRGRKCVRECEKCGIDLKAVLMGGVGWVVQVVEKKIGFTRWLLAKFLYLFFLLSFCSARFLCGRTCLSRYFMIQLTTDPRRYSRYGITGNETPCARLGSWVTYGRSMVSASQTWFSVEVCAVPDVPSQTAKYI